MIQFNLLPDIKVAYMKTLRIKRLVMLGAIAITAVSLFIMIMMFSYSFNQKRHLNNLNKDIKSVRSELEGNKELTKMLSVQNQLNKLPELYAGRPAASRLSGFIEQTTPNDVSLSKLSVDFSTGSLEISGRALELKSINKYVDTLKYTTFKPSQESEQIANAFKDVVLKSHGSDNSSGSAVNQNFKASYTISLKFDLMIFDSAKEIILTVPGIVTTHAQNSDGTTLFDTTVKTSEEGGM